MVDITDLHYPANYTISDTAYTEVVAEKTTRTRTLIVITNTSTLNQVISLGIGQDAIAGQGITIYPGATYIEVLDAAFKPTNARITAISSAANGSISVYERSG